jgi:hypothetical protein
MFAVSRQQKGGNWFFFFFFFVGERGRGWRKVKSENHEIDKHNSDILNRQSSNRIDHNNEKTIYIYIYI